MHNSELARGAPVGKALARRQGKRAAAVAGLPHSLGGRRGCYSHSFSCSSVELNIPVTKGAITMMQ
jgi:hypothetical protein